MKESVKRGKARSDISLRRQRVYRNATTLGWNKLQTNRNWSSREINLQFEIHVVVSHFGVEMVFAASRLNGQGDGPEQCEVRGLADRSDDPSQKLSERIAPAESWVTLTSSWPSQFG